MRNQAVAGVVSGRSSTIAQCVFENKSRASDHKSCYMRGSVWQDKLRQNIGLRAVREAARARRFATA
eukprot:6191674-Pleurochrysis_carterae.AAC.3